MGANLFVWAVGNALTATPTMGMHRAHGFLTLDFSKVLAQAQTAETTPAPSVPEESEDMVDSYFAPVIVGQCSSGLLAGGWSIQLTPDLALHWKINDIVAFSDAKLEEVPSLTLVLQYEGMAWL